MVASIVVLARAFAVASLVVAAGCGSDVAPAPAEREGAVVVDPPTPVRPTEADHSIIPITSSAPRVLEFFDPRLLAQWDAQGDSPLAFVHVLRRIHDERALPQPTLPAQLPASSADVLARFEPTWAVVASTLAADVDRVVRELDIDWEMDITRTYDVDAAKTEVGRDRFHRGNGNVARVFQPRWLTSPDGRFLLAAVIYRPDRRDFLPGTCGEVRLVYRLGYEVTMEGRVYASRMPFTANVVFAVPDDGRDCRDVADAWRSEAPTDATAAAIAERLLAGPLALDRLRFLQLELDAQLVRFPSDLENVDGRKFAGQALYWMRIFALEGGRFRPMPLENTPDVQAIRADPAKRAALLAFVERELAAIDRGVFLLPTDLLADVAFSWSTLGSARLANKPFASIIERAEADAIVARAPAGPRTFVDGGAALLERLDASSCMGCHQSSSTAGFHVLGIDREFGVDRDAVALATDGNRLELPFSPHFAAERARRAAVLERLATGRTPDVTRPHPSAPPAAWADDGPRFTGAATNTPCVIDDSLAAGARWACAEGLECRAVAHDPAAPFRLGQCVPARADVQAGVSCRAAHVVAAAPGTDLLAWNVRAFADRVEREDSLYAIGEGAITTTSYNCRPSRIGVPLGRVTRNCRSNERTLAAFARDTPTEVCAIVGGKGFEQMARGYFDSRAFAAGVGRGLLDTCSPSRFCREDYICQQLPDFLVDAGVDADTIARVHAEHIGFCTPTYFVYQLRLDGHPNPR